MPKAGGVRFKGTTRGVTLREKPHGWISKIRSDHMGPFVGLGISQHAHLADQVVTTKLGLKQRPLPRPEQSQQKRPGRDFEFLAVERPVVIVVGGSEE